MSEWSKVAEGDVEERERRGGGPASRDLSGALGAGTMTLRVWRYGPGHEMAYHRHQEQEELYRLVSGGPQEVFIEGEVVTVEDGDWLRIPKDTARRIQNHTDREAVWLTVAAPPGAGIRDGIRLDPETGEEIPRT
ncbi:MAG TPA: cupin domain-containing protein [Miltoncostaeaceae bacterium]|jgi:quercetin dioxygenase-like cupin family protein|nr:cupin domain-containing protein [Miltoncostaeaceae bacterium]